MSKMNLKLTSAGVCIASALVAWRIVWATPAQGLTSTIVSGSLPPVTIKSETGGHEIEIKTKGFSDVYVVNNTIVPGGHTGWHSHPGPSIITVKSGTATEYHGDDPNTPHIHYAGSSFVDDGQGAHIVRNEGSVNLELVAFQILAPGAPRRIDQPQP